jgi:hypothetical protein
LHEPASHRNARVAASTPWPHARALRQQTAAESDILDAFRRGLPRQECAADAASRVSIDLPSGVVDVAAYRCLVAGFDAVDILSAAALQL